MKKLISIGVALALLTMAVVPGAVAAQDDPDTYAKAPFSIMAAALELIGTIVADLNSKMDLGLPFEVDQITGPLADFTAGPLTWTVDVLAWGLDILTQTLEIVLPEFMPDFAWLSDVLADIVCKLYTPFGSIEVACNET